MKTKSKSIHGSNINITYNFSQIKANSVPNKQRQLITKNYNNMTTLNHTTFCKIHI